MDWEQSGDGTPGPDPMEGSDDSVGHGSTDSGSGGACQGCDGAPDPQHTAGALALAWASGGSWAMPGEAENDGVSGDAHLGRGGGGGSNALPGRGGGRATPSRAEGGGSHALPGRVGGGLEPLGPVLPASFRSDVI